MKKILLIVFCLLVSSSTVFAEEVEVKIPDFDIRINGINFDSTREVYPFLHYKNITYLPMTWDMSQALGLTISWRYETGLKLEKSSKYTIETPKEGSFNSRFVKYHAKVNTEAVTINGRLLSKDQEYPLLVYKNITYFPMTYNYMVGEFGCDYSWSNEEGLSINADNNLSVILPEPVTHKVILTRQELEQGDVSSGIFTVKSSELEYIVSLKTPDFKEYLGRYVDFKVIKRDADGNEMATYTLLGGEYLNVTVDTFEEFRVHKLDNSDSVEFIFNAYEPEVYKIINKHLLKKYDFEEVNANELTLEKLREYKAFSLKPVNTVYYDKSILIDNINWVFGTRRIRRLTKENQDLIAAIQPDNSVEYRIHPTALVDEEDKPEYFKLDVSSFNTYFKGYMVLLYNEKLQVYKIIYINK